jgi:hypothetical protein
MHYLDSRNHAATVTSMKNYWKKIAKLSPLVNKKNPYADLPTFLTRQSNERSTLLGEAAV